MFFLTWDTQRGKRSQVKMEAETAVIQLPSKDHPASPEARRGKERSLPGDLRGYSPLNTLLLDFWSLELEGDKLLLH